MKIEISEQQEERYAELQAIALDAARDGELDTLSPMIEAGIEKDLCDTKGNTLLMLASYHGHDEVVKFLANVGADIEQRNNRGQTPLAGVAFKGYLRCAQVLVQHGANPWAAQGHGQTPVSFAAMFGRGDVLRFLQSQNNHGSIPSTFLSALAFIMRPLGKLIK